MKYSNENNLDGEKTDVVTDAKREAVAFSWGHTKIYASLQGLIRSKKIIKIKYENGPVYERAPGTTNITSRHYVVVFALSKTLKSFAVISPSPSASNFEKRMSKSPLYECARARKESSFGLCPHRLLFCYFFSSGRVENTLRRNWRRNLYTTGNAHTDCFFFFARTLRE